MKKLVSVLLIMVLLLTPLCQSRADDAPAEKLICITFDDGPWKYTEELLDGLAARGDVHVTFFAVGKYVALQPETVRRAWREGHQIASHTYTHPFLAQCSNEEVTRQLYTTDQELDKAIGFDFNYILRPPYGSYSDRVAGVAGVPAIFWSMNTSDYKTGDENVVYNQIVSTARDGAICCLHDTHYSTVRGALRAIDTLAEQGYRLVTVNELFFYRGISLENGKRYYSAYPGATRPLLTKPVIDLRAAAEGIWLTMDADAESEIFYTTDGSLPDPATGIPYTGPVLLDHAGTIRAERVVYWNGIRSGVSAVEARDRLLVNGKEVDAALRNLGGNNYIRLRDLAAALANTPRRFSVDWDADREAVVLRTGQNYTPVGGELSGGAENEPPAPLERLRAVVDGEELSFSACTVGGSHYIRLRDLADALGLDVGWNGDLRTVHIRTV